VCLARLTTAAATCWKAHRPSSQPASAVTASDPWHCRHVPKASAATPRPVFF
ncbi:hypothetical protein IWW54_005720, partial [Coemansia sp. RSA 2705]